jgi:hypothetical protein
MTTARPGAMWGALLAALGIVSLAGSVQAQQPGAGQPPRDDQPPRTGQPPRAGQPAVAADPAVVAVLEALERAGKELQTIYCAVSYLEEDQLNVSQKIKNGTIMFKRAEPHPMFLIAFKETLSDGIRLADKEWWLFRDRWLSEAKSKSTLIIAREYVAPGQRVDLFDLERSPIPIPFGQTKREVLDSFAVRLLPPRPGDPPNTDHLYCVPHPGNQLSREYKRLEYYVSRDIRLPVRIVAEEAGGKKISVATFMDVPADAGVKPSTDLSARSVNRPIPDEAFRLPPETQGYHVTKEALPPPGPPASAPRPGQGIGGR